MPRVKKEEGINTTLKLPFDKKLKGYITGGLTAQNQEAKFLIIDIIKKLNIKIQLSGDAQETNFVEYTYTWIFPIEKQLLQEFRVLCLERNINWQGSLRHELVEMANEFHREQILSLMPPIPEIR